MKKISINIFYYLLITLLFILLSLTKSDTTNETKIFGEIAGCFDINKFNKLKNLNNSHFQNFIPCFCQLLHNNFVNIKCLYGSKLDDLKQALRSTINANFIAKEVG